MNTRLKYIQNWNELAREANWSASKLAKKCNVSLSTLERYFRETMGKSPKAWLTENRQHNAKELLSEGFSVKETSSELGYKHNNQFSREFRNYWGFSPTEQLVLSPQIGKMT
jgi:AraC-like DNA-binding protein